MQISSAIAQLWATNLHESIRFYTKEVGLRIEFQYQDFYAGIRAGIQLFHLKLVDEQDPSIDFADRGEHFHRYLETNDAKATAETLKKKGIHFTKDVHETLWGTREFSTKDIHCISVNVDRLPTTHCSRPPTAAAEQGR